MFDNKLFDVEHALGMHASDFVLMPASAIYEPEQFEQFAARIPNCHVYMIGLMPRVETIGSRVEDSSLFTKYEVAGKTHELRWEFPPECTLRTEGDFCFPVGPQGQTVYPDNNEEMSQLTQRGVLNFKVLYVGQAYGTGGSRNALERLLKHETLQKISIQEPQDTHALYVLLLEVEADNTVFTIFNPRAQEKDEDGERISMGLDKLFGTDEAERITLYEASLIRYFKPKYNKEFKDSFPSTNLKILKDCYDKDFSTLIAELYYDELPLIFSDSATPSRHHIIKHDLHEEAERKAFFE